MTKAIGTNKAERKLSQPKLVGFLIINLTLGCGLQLKNGLHNSAVLLDDTNRLLLASFIFGEDRWNYTERRVIAQQSSQTI
ncbi:MAG: hypothetical protein DDT34_02126 [Firmicutes bacterium]|nr:hypothetical protein [Bacillota bacterium]